MDLLVIHKICVPVKLLCHAVQKLGSMAQKPDKVLVIVLVSWLCEKATCEKETINSDWFLGWPYFNRTIY